jgi:hypothetical protein
LPEAKNFESVGLKMENCISEINYKDETVEKVKRAN